MMTYKKYFVFTVGRLGFDPGSTWMYLTLEDQTKWYKLVFGFYWRVD